jgi:hypothetical protein
VASAIPSPAPFLSPLLRPGRILHFRGRSTLDVSRQFQAPAPRVGYVFATLQILEERADGSLVLQAENFLYGAEGRTPDRLSTPTERSTQVLVLTHPGFDIQAENSSTAARLSGGHYASDLPVHFTSDGFGLNAGAREAAGLYSLALPTEVFRRLAAGETVTRDLDFFLVREDPLSDRVVAPAGDGKRPEAAETRVRGRTVLRPAGRETYATDWRFPAPPLPADPSQPPEVAIPDRRVEIPALRVEVEADFEIERFGGTTGSASRSRRRDRLSWTVHHAPQEPWILAWEGTVADETGDPEKAVRREAFLSRALQRVEESSLDPPGMPP